MKKFMLFLILTVLFASNVYANQINVTIEGERVVFADQLPAIIDGRTLVPIRAVFEHIGFAVVWQEASQTVTLTRGNDIVRISIGSPQFTSNGQTHALDVPAQIIGGRTLLPIRAVLESVGYTVSWNASTNTVIVTAAPERQSTTIPNRRLTESEIEAWTNNYQAYGGANDFELEVVRLTNIEREAAGVPPLEPYEPLMMAARFKAQSLFDLSYFNHTSPVYGNFSNIAREVFKMPPRSMGENLAQGHRTPEDVVQGWMDSGGHRTNILNPEYTRIGVGFYNNRWVQNFSN
ncbi:MAG: CAP domain-containing protein [Clostridiales bacterium]|jgi:uncharacterized protein YkwD|nr:CAP domain-containing protein [Clostridiales bacterium]